MNNQNTFEKLGRYFNEYFSDIENKNFKGSLIRDCIDFQISLPFRSGNLCEHVTYSFGISGCQAYQMKSEDDKLKQFFEARRKKFDSFAKLMQDID